MAWAFIEGKMETVYSTNERVVLEHGKGGLSVIEFLGPDKPVTALGFTMSLDGDQRHQLKILKEKTGDFCTKIKSAFLTEKETLQALRQRLEPKLAYPLQLTSLSKKEVRKINSQIRHAFLLQMRLNRNMPGAVVHGSTKHGGLGILDVFSK